MPAVALFDVHLADTPLECIFYSAKGQAPSRPTRWAHSCAHSRVEVARQRQTHGIEHNEATKTTRQNHSDLKHDTRDGDTNASNDITSSFEASDNNGASIISCNVSLQHEPCNETLCIATCRAVLRCAATSADIDYTILYHTILYNTIGTANALLSAGPCELRRRATACRRRPWTGILFCVVLTHTTT